MTKDVIVELVKTSRDIRPALRLGAITVILVSLLLFKIGHEDVSVLIAAFSAFLYYTSRKATPVPGEFRAVVTKTKLVISEPYSNSWTLIVSLDDICSFVDRFYPTESGYQIEHGILMKNGSFHTYIPAFGVTPHNIFEMAKSARPHITYREEEEVTPMH